MFCTKCGAELPEGTKFCPACGTPAAAAGVASSTAPATPSPEAGAQSSEDPLARFWNSPKFGWAAVYFNRVLNYVYIGLGLLLLAYGWWAIALVLIIGGSVGAYSVLSRKYHRTHTKCPACGQRVKIGDATCKKCGASLPVQQVKPDTLQEAELEDSANGRFYSLKAKKITLLCTPLLIPFIVILFSVAGDSILGTPVYQIQNAVFSQYGSQTVEQVVDDNFRGPEWSSEKLDENSSIVYVEGYMPLYSEDVRLTFYYEDQGDGTFQYSINSVALLDSGEIYTDFWNITLFMELLYS